MHGKHKEFHGLNLCKGLSTRQAFPMKKGLSVFLFTSIVTCSCLCRDKLSFPVKYGIIIIDKDQITTVQILQSWPQLFKRWITLSTG